MKKLVFVGCGGIAEYHLGNMLGYKADFLDKHGIELAGFCDIIPERAQAFVDKVGSGKAYTDYRTMYDEIQPNIAFICIPPYCHGELDLETFRRGIHAYVEKPVALDLDLAGEILDVIRRNNVITAVGFQCRYGRVSDLARQFCAEHRVAFVDMTRMGGIPGTFWWQKKELSGGQIVEQTIHNFDIVRYALGDPIEVCTFGTRGFVGNVPDYDTEDLTTTIVRFENGALGTFSTGCYAEGPGCCENKIVFSAKDCRLDYHLLDKVVLYDSSAKEEEGASVVKGDGRMRGSNEGVVTKGEGDTGPIAEQTFLKAVLTGDPSQIRSPYSDGIKSLAFTLACNESMAKGGVVRVRTF